MRIEQDIKLDFKDVLIQPKRSVLSSRSQVNLTRRFKHRYGVYDYDAIPIISANMDMTGTIEMSSALFSHDLSTALHKHYDVDTLVNFFRSTDGTDACCGKNFRWNVFYSIGITDADLVKFEQVWSQLDEFQRPKRVCIDVANGYSQKFVSFVSKFREKYPHIVIMAGNVVTGNMTEELILSGADIIKCGIGPGCFVPGTLVKTVSGLKKIEDIKEGDIVITHLGNWQEVSKTFKYQENENIVSINNIKSTAHHEYYVLNKKYKDVVNDDNIHQYAEWISAKDLTKEYLLLEHRN